MIRLLSRTHVFLSLALASTVSQAKPLDVDLSPAPFAMALESLSALTGEKWTADRSFLFDVVMVKADAVEPAELRNRLAAALGGEWKAQDDGWRLVRKDSAAATAAATALQERRARLAKTVRDMAGKVDPKPLDTEAARSLHQQWTETMDSMRPGGPTANPGTFEKIGALTAQMPGARAVARILDKIDLAPIAAMTPYSRVVLATQPTLMQKSLSTAVWPEVRQFVQESLAYQKAEDEKRDPENERVFRFGAVIQGYDTRVVGTPTSAMLVAQRSGFADSIDLTLVVANEKGETLCTGGLTLAPPVAAPSAPAFAVTDTKPIAWSDESKALTKAVPNTAAGAGGGSRMVMVSVTTNGPGDSQNPPKARTITSDGGSAADRVPMEATLRERVLNPEKYDPLSLHVAEGIRKVAEAAGKVNVVAVLSDRLFGPMLGAVREQSSPKALAEQIQTRMGMDAVLQDGWLTLTPSDPAAARTERVDRIALGPLLRKLDQSGTLRLDERANYEATRPMPLTPDPMDNLIVSAVNPTFAAEKFGFGRSAESEMLRFYGRLTPTQRTALRQGTALPINELTASQIEALERMVWHSSVGPASLAPQEGQPMFTGMARGMSLSGPITFAAERTNVLGRGLAKSGSIQFKIDKLPAVVGSTPGGGKSVLTSEDLARNKLASEGGIPIMASAPVAFERFQPADKFEFDVTIQLGKDYGVRRWLDDFTFDPAQPAVPYGGLSAEFRKAVEDDYKDLKQMMDGMREGGFPGRPGGAARP